MRWDDPSLKNPIPSKHIRLKKVIVTDSEDGTDWMHTFVGDFANKNDLRSRIKESAGVMKSECTIGVRAVMLAIDFGDKWFAIFAKMPNGFFVSTDTSAHSWKKIGNPDDAQGRITKILSRYGAQA